MKTVIRIGSRESRLAVTQTELIKGQIEAHFPHIRVEIVTMKTTGDRILDRSLEQIGGKGIRTVTFRESAETCRRDFVNWRKKDFVLRFWQQPD